MANSVHSGHRSRMRKRFIDYGGESFETHEILEMLLYYSYPRVDTNPIAHDLLEKFGSLSNLIDSPYNALTEAGMTENAAMFIKLMPELFVRYADDRFRRDNEKLTVKNIQELLLTKYIGKTNEAVYLLLLNSKYQELFGSFISEGTHSHAEINVLKICEYAVRYKARYAVIAHNHPSGILVPSQADIKTTARLCEALKSLDVELLNHYILADGSSLGLKESKSFFKTLSDYEKSDVSAIYNR